MGFRGLLIVFLAFGFSSAQISKVCVPSTETVRCQNLNIDGSQVACEMVPTRMECAAKLLRGAADFGVFSDEELLVLAQHQPSEFRVVATLRDVNRLEPYSYEAVVVVPNNHTNGYAGLQNGRYCHPGFGVSDIRWSPRVLRALEVAAARTDRCEGDTGSKTAEELEVATLSSFFSEACRPGDWSANATLDADLKRRFPNLCAMCSAPGTCAGYNAVNNVNVAGVVNSNRHIQALDCLTLNGTVAFVAWQHVRDFFSIRNPHMAPDYSLLCEDGTLAPLTLEALNTPTSPCSLVKQPWGAVVARNAVASTVSSNLREWWPTGTSQGGSLWQSNLWSLLSQGVNAVLVYEESLPTASNYTGAIRSIPNIDAPACLPPHRWCTISPQELAKCAWVRTAAHTLGIQPAITCQQAAGVFDCLNDVMEARSDFLSVDSHYGYLARRHYNLSPVKLVQNQRGSTSRVAALIKASAAENITRFENLRDKVACFPEYGSIAYVAFVRTAQERGVISSSQCNYQRAAGEFFSSACAPGALHHGHTISISDDFNATTLCTACRPNFNFFNSTDGSNFTCAYNNSNLFFGNQGSVNCLASEHTDVAVVELQNINAQLQALNLNGAQFRALCANNSLAINNGTDIEDNCLIAHVVDSEILTRRNAAIFNSINSFLDSIDRQFGYNTDSVQLVNLHIYSPFDGVNDLLFKDSTIGLTEPSADASVTHQPARNYIELFRHLESCTSSATTTAAPGVLPGLPGFANRNIVSVFTMALMGLVARFVVY